MDLARLGDEVPVTASRQSALAAVQSLAGVTGVAAPETASAYAPSAGTPVPADLVPTPASRFAPVDPQHTASTLPASTERKWQFQIAAATSAARAA